MALAGAVVSKPMPKKTTRRCRVGLRDAHGVERRVDDPHVGAAALQREQVAARAGHPQHVAERGEDHVRAAGDGVRLVDHLQRGDADRAAGAVHQLDRGRQHAVDAVADDRVGLAAADLHQHPGLGGGLRRSSRSGPPATLAVAVFVEVFHRRVVRRHGRPSARRSGRAPRGCDRSAPPPRASIMAIAKPTWTRT